MNKIADRARNLYGDCLKLQLLTPIMAEAYLNMMILTFCKPETRNNPKLYQDFLREKIPKRLELLACNCFGFARAVNSSSDTYKDFMRVMNARNFNIHGNIDPLREKIETVYFEGKRHRRDMQGSGDTATQTRASARHIRGAKNRSGATALA